ncbi:hypothetical protein GCM10022220_00120 [Actinocatenispora rupis]|uniref:Uncharacterized protein n=2 Tax=Actinocatenispora rupis TaxID=519421 RepID=A0A8J3NEI7_9ACTN|nr:hypothetical protein Aru02nite_49660 [Actinocatenispora rupis]
MAALQAEEPVIDAEVALVDAEIAVLAGATELTWRRLRAAERALFTAWRIYRATQPTTPHRPSDRKQVA